MSIIGKIGKEIGEEVAEGLAKNATPVVKNAAKSLESKYKRKPTDIEDKMYLNFNDNDPVIKRNIKKLENYAEKNPNTKLATEFNAYQKMGTPSGTLKSIDETFSKYEKMGIPREATGFLYENPRIWKTYANSTRSIWKDELEFAKIWDKFYDLTKEQQDTFKLLAKEWDGTVDLEDLLEVSKSL